MAPKAAPEPVAKSPAVETEPDENAVLIDFTFAVEGVSNLPCDLETKVQISGLVPNVVSAAAEAGSAPQGWDWGEQGPSFSLKLGQGLFDDIASKEVVISLLDAAADGAIIGTASINPIALLHEQTRIGGQLELTLTDTYFAKWYPPPEPEEPVEPVDPKAKPAKSPSPPPAASPPPIDRNNTPGPPPGPTTIVFFVDVQQLIGPEEDRDDWTIMTMGLEGAYSLPEKLTGLGLTSGEDVENHQFTYKAMWLGEAFADGALVKPAEKEEAEDPARAELRAAAGVGEPGDDEAPVELTEAQWRAQQERLGFSVRFASDGGTCQRVRYRGAVFMNELRLMLNHAGGVWCHFLPEEKPSSDPKKPNPPELEALSKHFAGKAWLDMRTLIRPGEKSLKSWCPLVSICNEEEVIPDEMTLESSKSFVKMRFDLLKEVVPSEPADKNVHTRDLIPVRESVNKFPASSDAATMYKEAVNQTVKLVTQDCGTNGSRVEVPEAIKLMQKAGNYDVAKEELRNAVIRVFRERLKKDTGVVPGRPLTGEQRDKFFSDAYVYLKGSMVEVLQEFQPSDGGNPTMAQALVESATAREAKAVLAKAGDASSRCESLAYEAELVGNWDRAARLFQSRLVLEENRRAPKIWLEYAKFCMRAGGRQAAAEEAVNQAKHLFEDRSVPRDREVTEEVDLMLAGLLLDRDRHEEALRIFRSFHQKDMADPFINFMLGLALYLNGDEDLSKPLLGAVAQPRGWFDSLPDDSAIADKLRLFDQPEDTFTEPYYQCLERLLDFGLPSLIFTFIDQCGIFTESDLEDEALILIDARAMALNKDWLGASARLQPLCDADKAGQSKKGASREVWRLAGECHIQLQDFDPAMAELQTAISSEQKFEDPAVYIRLGHVYLLKKRWKLARDAFLQSIMYRPTAEAWSGIGYAEYRADEGNACYEALCEANLLDNERADIWAQLCLLHFRTSNKTLADHCFQQCLLNDLESDELFLEIATDYIAGDGAPSVAESAARAALRIRETGQGHSLLAESLAKGGELEKAILEAQVAMQQLFDKPEDRKVIFDKAVGWAGTHGDATLTEALHAVQKLADKRLSDEGSR